MAKRQPDLPNKAAIAKLPRWAIVALATRCARHALPLIQSSGLASVHKNSLTFTIITAEKCAAKAYVGNIPEPKAATAAADAADAAALKIVAPAHEVMSAVDTANAFTAAAAAAIALYAAGKAIAEHEAAKVEHAKTELVRAASDAVKAASDISKSIHEGIISDFNRLVTLATSRNWTDTTPVPPTVFPPLPKRSPFFLPGSVARDDLPFDLWIDPGHASTETLQNVLIALSELHLAAGGAGLEFQADGDFVHVREMTSA
jgi:hypothetical protein